MDANLKETQRILVDALAGAEGRLGALLERLRPRLVLWCAARMSAAMRAKLDPEDAAQEILLAVAKDFSSYRGPADRPFFKWLFVLADHKLRDLADHENAKKRQRPDEEPGTSSQTSPSQAAQRVEMAARLRDAIERLPEDYRVVVRLYKLEGHEVGEVAAALDRSENAVRILYCRALKELRRILEDGAGGVGGFGTR